NGVRWQRDSGHSSLDAVRGHVSAVRMEYDTGRPTVCIDDERELRVEVFETLARRLSERTLGRRNIPWRSTMPQTLNLARANPEHLKMFELGVAEWNAWREANPYVLPVLTGKDFS